MPQLPAAPVISEPVKKPDQIEDLRKREKKENTKDQIKQLKGKNQANALLGLS